MTVLNPLDYQPPETSSYNVRWTGAHRFAVDRLNLQTLAALNTSRAASGLAAIPACPGGWNVLSCVTVLPTDLTDPLGGNSGRTRAEASGAGRSYNGSRDFQQSTGDDVWISWWTYFEDFRTSADGNGYIARNGTFNHFFQIHGSCPLGSPELGIFVENLSGANADLWRFGGMAASGGAGVCGASDRSAGTFYKTPGHDGLDYGPFSFGWHQYTCRWKPSYTNGITQVWIDGVLVRDHTGCNIHDPTDTSHYAKQGIYVGTPFGWTSTKTLRLFHAGLTVATTRAEAEGSGQPPLPPPPQNLALPTISGGVGGGQTLTATPGTWSGSPTFAYQWQSSPDAGASWANIAGETATAYAVDPMLSGSLLRVAVTGTENGVSATAFSLAAGPVTLAPVSPFEGPPSAIWDFTVAAGTGGFPPSAIWDFTVAADAPANTTPPTLTGLATVGQTLTATPGSWDNFPDSYRYQWQRDTHSGGVFYDIASADAAAYETAILADSPVGYWHLDEAAGTFADSSGGSHTGTGVGGITRLQDGISGYAVSLDGTSAAIEVADHADLDVGDTLTLEVWLKPGVQPLPASIIDKGLGGYQLTLLVNNTFRLQVRGGAIICSSTAPIPADGHLHHVAVTKDGSDVHLYLDGVDVSGTVTNATLADTSDVLRIGSTTVNSNWFDGVIDEPAVYAVALSAAEVAAHVAAGVPNTYELVDADDGSRVRCQVTATNAVGSGTAETNPYAPIVEPAPVNTVLPAVPGTLKAGVQVTATPGSWDNMDGYLPAFAYQWQRSADGATGWADIAGATSLVYRPVLLDVTYYLRIVETATNTGGAVSATSAASSQIGAAPVTTGTARVVIQAAFGSNPTDATYAWTTIGDSANPASSYVDGVSYARGRQNERQETETGTGQVLVGDAVSDFDPDNTDSVFYPDVKPMVPIRAYAVPPDTPDIPMFLHYAERWPRTERVTSVFTRRAIETVDGFGWLANTSIGGHSYPPSKAGARFTAVLDDADWPTALRNLDAGSSDLIAADFADVADQKALQHLLAVNQTENGFVYMDAAGNARLIARHKLLVDRYATPRAQLSDVEGVVSGPYGSGLYGSGPYGGVVRIKYVNVVPSYDLDQVTNDWTGSRDGGPPQNVSDTASQAAYGPRSASFTSLATLDAEVLAQAQWKAIQFANPLNRIDSVTVQPGDDLDAWRTLLYLDVGDRITILETPPGFDTEQEADYTIQHLAVQIGKGPLVTATFTFQLWPADDDPWFVFGSDTGKFNVGALAY